MGKRRKRKGRADEEQQDNLKRLKETIEKQRGNSKHKRKNYHSGLQDHDSSHPSDLQGRNQGTQQE